MAKPTYRGFRGAWLRELRTGKSWTQEALGVRMGVFPPLIGKWERGETVPDSSNVVKLARLFGQTPQSFTSVPLEDATLVDLRVWAGFTRATAAAAARMSVKRLFNLEHYTTEPTVTEAATLARAYGVTAATVSSTWSRGRRDAYPETVAR